MPGQLPDPLGKNFLFFRNYKSKEFNNDFNKKTKRKSQAI